MEKYFADGKKLQCVQDDITKLSVDAIVNAANEQLAHGGGVAKAISKAGGRLVQKESTEWVKKNGPVKTGSAAITNAGELNARYVIHAVGPVMGSGQEDEKLRSATRSALQLAETHQLHSIAFPAISTGIFGYPLKKCARIMISESIEFLKSGLSVQHIIFCLFSQKAYDVFVEELSGK